MYVIFSSDIPLDVYHVFSLDILIEAVRFRKPDAFRLLIKHTQGIATTGLKVLIKR